MNKLIITYYKNRIVSVLFDGDTALEINFEDPDSRLKVGDIYRGRVRDIVKNIRAAFVEILPGTVGFMALERGSKVKPGDELTVQISREPIKTKDAAVTEELTIPGKYCVLTKEYSLGASGKIKSEERREELKALLAPLCGDHEVGFIIRTNAEEAADEDILAEAESMIAAYEKINQRAACSTLFTRLYTEEPVYIERIRDSRTALEIITDIPEVYEKALAYCGSDTFGHTVSLYEDPQLGLDKLYRVESVIEEALSKTVWLKSGAYLVIEPTEALTVIDVNTGKFEGNGAKEDTFLKVNEEAAAEAARQLRLRNISGIVVVDFIDMKRDESYARLKKVFSEALSEDPVKTAFADFTKLGLAELTRKKIRKSLKEQLD